MLLRIILVILTFTGEVLPAVDNLIGGTRAHDLFSSTDELKKLFERERQVADSLRWHVRTLEQHIKALENFLGQHYGQDYPFGEKEAVDEKTAAEYVSNPLNTYALIKRTGLHWPRLHKVLIEGETIHTEEAQNETISVSGFTEDQLLKNMPQQMDIEGAANGIFLLQEIYNLDMKKFSEGILEVPGKLGEEITDQSAILNAVDCEMLAKLAFNRGFYDRAVEWMETAIWKLKAKEGREPELRHLQLLGTMKAKHDQVLVKKGPRGDEWRTFTVPFDKNLAKKKKFKKIKDKRYKFTLNLTANAAQSDMELWETFNAACRGEGHRHHTLDINTTCYYLHYGDPYLRLAPFKVEMVNVSPFVSVLRDFMHEHEADELRSVAGEHLRRSRTGASGDGREGNFATVKRTSSQVWVTESVNPWIDENYDYRTDAPKTIVSEKVTRALARRIERAVRLHAAAYEAAEAFQVANYGIGGFYTHHTDSTGEFNTVLKKGMLNFHLGDRLATAMGYLTDVPAGGATVFPNLGLTLWPKKGDVAFWFNNDRSGRVDSLTYHGGCPGRSGSPGVTNKRNRAGAPWRV